MSERRPYLVRRAFRSYLVATVMSTMAVSFGSILGSIVVGNVLGPTALGAVNVMMPVIQLLAAINALINIGGATLMAVSMGKGRTDDVRGIFTGSMIMSLAVSLAVMVVGVASIDRIMGVLCTDPALLTEATDYGRLVFLLSPLYILMPGLGTFVRTDNSPRLATLAFVAMNATNLVLAYILMAHTDMGLTGFAVSTAVGYAVGIVVLLPHFRRKDRAIGLGRGSAGYGRILYMGAPVALAMALLMVNMLGMNRVVMDHMGADGMTIRSVCLNIQMISSIFVSGISQTLQPVGGTLYGSEDLTGMRIVTRTAATYQMSVACAIMLIALAAPALFLTLYGVNDPAIYDEATRDIRLFAPFIVFQAVNYMTAIIYQVFGHRPMALAISVMECGFTLAFAYSLVSFSTDFIWLSFVMGEALTTVAIAALSLAIRWRRPEFQGMALLRAPSGVNMDASMSGDGGDMQRVLDEVSGFLGDNGVPRIAAERARLCCEEILSNVIEHGVSRDPDRFVDVIVRVDGGRVMLTVRDDGPMFDPIKYDEGSGLGLLIVKSQCSTLNYARSIGQNNVFIGIDAG